MTMIRTEPSGPRWPLNALVWVIAACLWCGEPCSGAAPVWASRPTYAVPDVPKVPWPAEWDDFAKDAWAKAPQIERFFVSGDGEGEAARTQVRLLKSQGILYVFFRCHDAQGDKIVAASGPVVEATDSVEILIAQDRPRDYPLLRVEVAAGGRCAVTRELIPTAMWGEIVNESVDPDMVTAATGTGKQGWWAVVKLPLEKLGVSPDKLRMNLLRNRSAQMPRRSSWVDLWGGRLRNLARMGIVTSEASPREPVPAIDLPATLSVGSNVLKLSNWREGYVLKVNGKPTAVKGTGPATLDIVQHGPVELTICTEAPGPAAELCGYTCDVRRPLIVQAQPAFGGDVAKPLTVEVTLDIAAETKAEVSLEARQNGKRVGQAKATLPAGSHKVDVPLQGAAAGEVQVVASAELAMPGGKLSMEARHGCVLGVGAETVARYREGIDKLPIRSLVRAAVADAGEYWRLAQGGNGLFTQGRADPVWPQGITYLMALLYKTNWPENPHVKDERFLASAAAGMEAALDPAARQKWLDEPDNRSLQGFLLTYELLKDDVPPAQAQRWRASLTEIVESVVETWLRPAEWRLARYSDDVGTGTNHWAFHAANVYTAGRVLARKDWLELGQRSMRSLARQEKDGQFSERRGVPTLSYNWLTQTAMAEYFRQSADPEVAACVDRCTEFAWRTLLPGGLQWTLFDGRVNAGGSAKSFALPAAFTPQGRWLLRTNLLAQFKDRPPNRISPEAWYRLGELALAIPADAETPPPVEDEFIFIDGLALIGKHKGFGYGLSAICLPPITGLYRLDPQNAVELYHAQAGFILRGNNSQNQPEAGSFHRVTAQRTVWLPTTGRIVRAPGGHSVSLEYEGFKVRLRVEVLSEDSAQVTVELLDAQGPEPVIYSFFPAGTDVKISDDGRSVQLPQATIQASLPLESEKGFKLYNAYSGRQEIGVKPTRVFARLQKGRPLVLTVKVDAAAK